MKGKDIIEFSQYGTSEELNEIGAGYPVLRLNEFDSSFISKPAKYCDQISNETYDALRLCKDDVLICRTNGNPKYVGRSALVPRDYPYAFASYLYRIRPNRNLIYPATLVTYLNSKYGRIAIEKYSMVGNQANFSPAKFKEIVVPIFSKRFNEKIEIITYKAFSLLENSARIYKNQELFLIKELSLDNWKPSNESTAVKLFSAVINQKRWDAEYYMPIYEELKSKLHAYAHGTKTLHEVADTYRGNLICDELYCNDQECEAYIRGADISSNILKSDKLVYIDKSFVPQKEIICQYNDIVFAIIGSVGTAALVTKSFIGSYISNNLGLIRIKDNNIKAEYLHLFLTSPMLGGLLFEQQQKQTAQPKISDSDIWNFPIPQLDNGAQDIIAKNVQDSFKLQNESNHLLSITKRAVEVAVENSEEEAIKFLNQNNIL